MDDKSYKSQNLKPEKKEISFDDIKKDKLLLKKFKALSGAEGYYWQRVPGDKIKDIIKKVMGV